MMVVDANILVRYAVKDDPHQTRIATDFLKQNECLVSRTVLLELAWVLAGAYKLSRDDILEWIQHIGLPSSAQPTALTFLEYRENFDENLIFASG
jgi:predicted nucleic-acid-binding protein